MYIVNKRDELIKIEWDSSREILEIHGNQKGLEKLKNVIDDLLSKNGNDHVHLMTESWGGNELSNETQCPESETINHVKIFRWVDKSQ